MYCRAIIGDYKKKKKNSRQSQKRKLRNGSFDVFITDGSAILPILNSFTILAFAWSPDHSPVNGIKRIEKFQLYPLFECWTVLLFNYL